MPQIPLFIPIFAITNSIIMPDSIADKPPYWLPTEHSHKRRATWHDYSAPGTYMITLVVANREPLLGTLLLNPRPFIEYSPLAQEIRHSCIPKISYHYPFAEVWKHCTMPDHIHMIIRLKVGNQHHLGQIISGFKKGCNQAPWKMHGQSGPALFEAGYNDRLLFNGTQLKAWKRYLDDNPRRLAVKRQHPDLFIARHNIAIAGSICHSVGNRFLLSIPDKAPVIVHRRDNDEEYREKIAGWMNCGERGGVLIGTGIAERERWVMREALIRGYKTIVLLANGFPQYYKPSGEKFDACSRGEMLLLCPWDYDPAFRKPSREQCLALNKLAEAIALAAPIEVPR